MIFFNKNINKNILLSPQLNGYVISNNSIIGRRAWKNFDKSKLIKIKNVKVENSFQEVLFFYSSLLGFYFFSLYFYTIILWGRDYSICIIIAFAFVDLID